MSIRIGLDLMMSGYVPAFETIPNAGPLIVRRWGQKFMAIEQDEHWRLLPYKDREVLPDGKVINGHVDTENTILVEKQCKTHALP